MNDRRCTLHEGFTLAFCSTCGGTEAHDDFACADWARQLADQAIADHLAAFLREMRAILPEVEITAEHVARKFEIGIGEAETIMQKVV